MRGEFDGRDFGGRRGGDVSREGRSEVCGARGLGRRCGGGVQEEGKKGSRAFDNEGVSENCLRR